MSSADARSHVNKQLLDRIFRTHTNNIEIMQKPSDKKILENALLIIQ